MVTQLLPALVPLAALLWIRAADHSVTISRNQWDPEYDFIVGEHPFPIFRVSFLLARQRTMSVRT